MLEQIDLKATKMTKEEYKPVHDELVDRLVVLQQEARKKGLGLVVLVEGWSGAGKGSRISDLIYELDARATKVHMTKDINPRKARKFAGLKWGVLGEDPLMEQFWQGLGERGMITFYDRGWYAVATEQTMFGLARMNPKRMKKLRKQANKANQLPMSERGAILARNALERDAIGTYQKMAFNFEQMLVDDGYAVVKLFVHISKKAQKKRLNGLHKNSDTAWRVSKRKLKMIKYYDHAYKIYDELLKGSNFEFAPWTIVNGEDRRRANVQIAQALVDALEAGLAAAPDAAAEAAKLKAAENSEHAAAAAERNPDVIDLDAAEAKKAEAVAQAEAESNAEAAAKRAEAEAEAAAQSALAPEASAFSIVEDYPQIDHSIEKPRIETREEYRKQLKKEQARFHKLQEELYLKRVPLLLMYEGWDAAGKGGNIERVAKAMDARAYSIYPSPAPTKPELAHPHLWRYWTRIPDAGHVGIYDRSWYGRVLVERIEGFASPEQWSRAYDEINQFEHELVLWGAILLKFWVDVTPDEQLARFEARASDPAKMWKITDEDWRNREKYPQYKAAINDMFRLTSTEFAPWIVLESDDKHYARVQALRAINEAIEARLHKD